MSGERFAGLKELEGLAEELQSLLGLLRDEQRPVARQVIVQRANEVMVQIDSGVYRNGPGQRELSRVGGGQGL
jgi:hypothetical protein